MASNSRRQRLGFVLVFLALAGFSLASVVPSSSFGSAESKSLQHLAQSAQKADGTFRNIREARFAVGIWQSLSTQVPQKTQICAFAQTVLKDSSSDVTSLAYAAITAEALNCGEKVSSAVTTKLESALETQNLALIHNVIQAIVALKQNSHATFDSDLSAVASEIAELINADGSFKPNTKTDDGSALATGQAYNALALLKKHFTLSPEAEEQVDAVLATVADFISTAETETGDLAFAALNPLDNLKATALIFTGANALASTYGSVELNQNHVSALASYFLKNKHANNVEDGYHLATAFNTLTKNTFKLSPLSVHLPKGSFLTSSKGEDTQIRIQVTDIFGNHATPVHVFITKVSPVNNPKQVIASNIQARPLADTSDNTVYTASIFTSRPEQGVYAIELSVSPLDKNSAFFPVTAITRTVKFVASVELVDASLRIADAKEQDEADAAAVRLSYPNTANEVKVNVLQSIFFSFRLTSAGRPATAQQAFLKFTNVDTQHETIIIATQQGKKYKFVIPLKDQVDSFRGHSGRYAVTLIVGDALIQNPLVWHVVTLNVHFGQLQRDYVAAASNVLPEIVHQFRPAERQPSAQVSLFFTGLTLAPILIFLFGLATSGANLSKLPSNPIELLFAVGFVASIGSILGLFFIYWLRLNMMTALQYLGVLALAAIFLGHRALRYLATLSSSSSAAPSSSHHVKND
eukprot:TRINITY_DN7004_c0_g1_i2.p1 TRINITY_DN7004_c0_g1~~TRINITY_DN7004_c0_g1_i2.p1  ORF type:complete len:728 (-),score=97.25 TRINITY_DN7004_c0_g1_i2:48-2135(-)